MMENYENLTLEQLKLYKASIEEYKEDVGNFADTEKMFYETFLIQTDHIPNKIIESLVENLADATALNFISVFIQFIKDVKVNYNDILLYRKFAREEISRLEGGTEGETS